ncbi:MAG TPA: RNB domain-containing ribonuclease [Candidatus Paceibacterota bacterium]
MKNKPKKEQTKHKNLKTLKGVIKVISKPMGFFMLPDTDRSEDVVVFEEGLNCALDKDEVEVEIIGKDRDRKKGRVVRILNRNKTEFVGTLENSLRQSADGVGDGLVFVPDDFKFYRKIELVAFPENATSGQKVLVKMLPWTNQNLNPKGEVLKVIGKKGEHETEMQSIILDKGIVYDFPEEVEEEAKKVAEDFFAGADRRDFRDVLTFTIDPVDAKDFDDALSYREIGEGKIEVGVHIADVSHFVRPGTALDREARKRLFSTYLVDRTIPMLPEVLSNDLCSLNPNVDRFAFSAVFEIEKNPPVGGGKILKRWFGKTIINSDKRFSYEEAQEVLNAAEKRFSSESPRPPGTTPSRTGVSSQSSARLSSENFFQPLAELNRLANIYRAENKKEGAIEFETDEVKFELDEKGKPIRIYKKPRLDTMKMIEEWMLLANREVAKFISEKLEKRGAQAGAASIYRVHDLPNMDKLEELAIFVRALGHELPVRGGEVSARDLNILLTKIEGHSAESLVKTAAIRSMAKAIYSTQNIGHFGLAFEYYTHFTSPIRRYPDLVIHRILENHLNGGHIKKDEFAYLQKICNEASEKEIVVAEAERESIKYKQVEFMQSRVGQEFDAVISGVTEWGMYVEDPSTKAEGMIRLKEMNGDLYQLDAKNYAIVGANTKKKYSLGDSVRVRLVSADLDRKILDFKLV